jgi:hypothetical protein
MNDLSHISINELHAKITNLNQWIDCLSLELADVDQELIRRFQLFGALCLAPPPPETVQIFSRRVLEGPPPEIVP